MFFTAGQFAKIHNINKRTLHYYDEIGLFSPSHRGDNGYRYYTYQQSPTLEMLLALRELGMSIEEIKNYMESPSVPALKELLTERQEEIRRAIARMKELKGILAQKEAQLDLCFRAGDDVELIHCPEEYLLLSPVSYVTDDSSGFEAFLGHLTDAKSLTSYRKNCGSMISAENVLTGQFDEYDYLFTAIDRPLNKKALFRRPAGSYLRAFCTGSWDRLPEAYGRIVSYAKANSLTLTGYAYEEGLNEMAISDMDDYITQILIGCDTN